MMSIRGAGGGAVPEPRAAPVGPAAHREQLRTAIGRVDENPWPWLYAWGAPPRVGRNRLQRDCVDVRTATGLCILVLVGVVGAAYPSSAPAPGQACWSCVSLNT